LKKNIKRLSIIILLVLLFAAAGVIVINYYGTETNTGKFTIVDISKIAKVEHKQKPVSKMPVKRARIKPADSAEEKEFTKEEVDYYKNKKFETVDEIKNEFGRLEIVHLYNGRNFTGYVLAINDFYNMITIDGFRKIPMKDVKLREIIN
jgi:hypothetical protein